MFSVFRNPDLVDNMFDCLLKVTAKDRMTSFLFVVDVHAHHEA